MKPSDHDKEFGFYSKSKGKPLEGFKKVADGLDLKNIYFGSSAGQQIEVTMKAGDQRGDRCSKPSRQGGGLAQGGHHGDAEKRKDLGSILNVEPTGLAGELEVGDKGKGGIQKDS